MFTYLVESKLFRKEIFVGSIGLLYALSLYHPRNVRIYGLINKIEIITFDNSTFL